MVVEFTAPLWLWNGKGSWHFITVPTDHSALIRMAAPQRGFGSVRVRARIGEAEWKTSIFRDNKRGAYLLPVKADIRRATGATVGTDLSIRLALDL